MKGRRRESTAWERQVGDAVSSPAPMRNAGVATPPIPLVSSDPSDPPDPSFAAVTTARCQRPASPAGARLRRPTRIDVEKPLHERIRSFEGPGRPANTWSEWQDSNLRPPRPERGALPGCATLRHMEASIATLRRRRKLHSLRVRRESARVFARRGCRRFSRRSPTSPLPARVRPVMTATRARPALGRRQVVRQRFLVPPFPGSNPGAPARRVFVSGRRWPCAAAFLADGDPSGTIPHDGGRRISAIPRSGRFDHPIARRCDHPILRLRPSRPFPMSVAGAGPRPGDTRRGVRILAVPTSCRNPRARPHSPSSAGCHRPRAPRGWKPIRGGLIGR